MIVLSSLIVNMVKFNGPIIVLRKPRRCGAIVHLLFCIEESNKDKNKGDRLKVKIAAQSM